MWGQVVEKRRLLPLYHPVMETGFLLHIRFAGMSSATRSGPVAPA